MQISPEATLVNLPKEFVDKENIVGNMMELKNPMAIRLTMAMIPPQNMAINISTMLTKALKARHLFGAILLIMALPINLPTIAPPQ